MQVPRDSEDNTVRFVDRIGTDNTKACANLQGGHVATIKRHWHIHRQSRTAINAHKETTTFSDAR